MKNNKKPSAELLYLMDKLNLAPIQDGSFSSSHHRFELKYLKATGEAFSEFGEYDEERVERLLLEIFLEIRTHLNECFPNLLSYLDEEASVHRKVNARYAGTNEEINSFLYVWDEYTDARRKLIALQRAVRQTVNEDLSFGTWKSFFVHRTHLELHFEIKEDYTLEIKGDIVERALNGMDIRRIRFCRYCRELFWAYRLDNFTCSKKCGQNKRTEKFRKKQNNRFQSRVIKDGNL